VGKGRVRAGHEWEAARGGRAGGRERLHDINFIDGYRYG